MNFTNKTGPCIGGGNDGEFHPFSASWNGTLQLNKAVRHELPFPPWSASGINKEVTATVKRSLYHVEILGANEAVFFVFRCEGITKEEAMEKLIMGYIQGAES